MLRTLIVKILLVISLATNAQEKTLKYNQNDIVLEFRVISDSSSVFIIPNLIKKQKNNVSIQIPNKFDEDGAFPGYGGRVYIQKEVLGFFIDLNFAKLKGPEYDIVSLKLLKMGENRLDSFALNNVMPIEKGKYRLKLEMDCFLGKVKTTISSDFVDFECQNNFYYPAIIDSKDIK